MAVDSVQKVFQTVFNDPNLIIYPEMTAQDVESWDSFNHINLIVALEEEFRTTFSTDEIASMANVGDLIAILQRKGISVSWN